MTKTENEKCYFCQNLATQVKIEADEDEAGNIIPSATPVCDPCVDEWYDGMAGDPIDEVRALQAGVE